ncbi:penicillin-binding transpeptidase domain-containing protein [Actinoplanes sp. HUAS TT8]|uniref:penicillin-binding transpeptidase domain-containing protein n=1 Tax=Actinoplanes sp. HUAS TT8 TaxID=3447453 RepID=UPI003F52225E
MILDRPRRTIYGGIGLRLRAWLSVAAGVLLVAVIAVVVRPDPPSPEPAGAPPAVSSPAPRPVPSELYASDGTTLIARFDTGDPHAACAGSAYGFYCDYVATWWEQHKGLTSLSSGGYRIVGSLDVALQRVAQKRAGGVLPEASPKAFAAATVEPGSGLVRVMVADRVFGTPSASPSPFQWQGTVPGPIGQPLASEGGAYFNGGMTFGMFTLVAALEQGMSPSDTIDTEARFTSRYRTWPSDPSACEGDHWCPRNLDDPAYRSGKRTMWEGFGHSVVTYLVALEEKVGADRVVDVARRLGIRFYEQDESMAGPDIAPNWGAFTLGISRTSPLDLATAYATLAADGKHCEPLPVVRVVSADGQAVPSPGPECSQVVAAEVARAALDAGRCGVGDRPASGDRCGSGKVPADAVRGLVGRPVSGQLGVTDRQSAALVVAGPQLVTAGIAAGGSKRLPTGIEGRVVAAVSEVERSGLAPLPSLGFTPPA